LSQGGPPDSTPGPEILYDVFSAIHLSVGPHTITAVYSGDTHFIISTSSALGMTVGQAGMATTLTSSLNPSLLNQTVTFTAVVKAVVPGTGVPTGTMTFADGGTVLSTVPLSGGVVRLSTRLLSTGSHGTTATYRGDTNLTSGTTAGVTQVVNATTSAVVSAPMIAPALVSPDSVPVMTTGGTNPLPVTPAAFDTRSAVTAYSEAVDAALAILQGVQ
jgi:hypothetical protein